MNGNIIKLIDKVKEQSLRGNMPSKEEIITLLEIDPASNESEYLLKTARDMAHTITSNTAYLLGRYRYRFRKMSYEL